MGRMGLGLVVMLCALALPSPAAALPAATPLDARIQELRGQLPGDGEARAVTTLLDQAEADERAAAEKLAEAARLQAEAEAAAGQIAALQAARARDARAEFAQWRSLLPDEEPVESAESRLQSARNELDASRGALSATHSELAILLALPRSLVEGLASARSDLQAARERHDAALQAATTDSAALQRARAVAAEAAVRKAQATLGLLEAQQQTLPTRQRLLEARRRGLERDVMLAQQRFELLQERADRFRESAADARQQELLAAQRDFAEDFPALQTEVDTNLQLIERLGDLEQRLTAQRQAAEAGARQVQATEDALRSTRARLDIGAADEALGLVMLAERRRLADPRRLHRDLDETRLELARARLSVLDINDRLVALDDIDATLARARSGTGDEDEPDEAHAAGLADALEQLLDLRAGLLPELLETTQHLVTALSERERNLQCEIALTDEFATLLDRRLLWIPSHAAVDLAWLGRHPAGWHDLFKPSRFPTTGRLLWQSLPERWDVLLAIALLAATIPWLRRRLPAWLGQWASPLRHVSSDRFRFTLRALLATLLAALPMALSVFGVAWLLQNIGTAGRYSDSLGLALASTVPALYVSSLLYWLCHGSGLAAVHFKWPETRRRALLQARHWLLWGLVPLQFVLGLAFVRNLDPALDTAGRDVMLLMCALSAWLSWRLLAPDGIWVTSEGGRHHGLRRLARVALPAALVVIAMLVLNGYLLTAGLLVRSLWLTGLLVLALGIFHALVARWLLLGERRLAMRRYLEHRAEEADPEGQPEVTTESGEVIPDIEPDEVTLHSVNAQTRRLLRALLITLLGLGLIWVWSGLLPALGRLDEIVLWQVSAVDGTGAGFLESISLKAVLLGLFALVLTFIAARNLPGLVEIGLLSSAAVDAPTRYAITSISRYLIVIVGLVVGVGLLGLRWSQLQWMAAALTVGLGFGLQEIFANFISGLILLFERPFRVGDVITIGDLTGTVTKIRTRATTLRDFDNKELVVPNKTFITSQLINWTLSDTRTRITVKVGVAYGTPPEKVHELLRQAAREHPLVMEEPGPASWFMSFGDSSLDFELRVFVGSFADRLVTLNELNMRIASLFAEHGIEIAFPQMDLHVRDLPPRRPPPRRDRADEGDPGPAPAR